MNAVPLLAAVLDDADNAAGLQNAHRISECFRPPTALVFEAIEMVQRAHHQDDVDLAAQFIRERTIGISENFRAASRRPFGRARHPVCGPSRFLGEKFRRRKAVEELPHVDRIIGADDFAVWPEIAGENSRIPDIARQRVDDGHARRDAEEFKRLLRMARAVSRLVFVRLRREHDIESCAVECSDSGRLRRTVSGCIPAGGR